MNSTNTDGQRPPSWKEFLTEGIDRCDTPHNEMKRLLIKCDYLSCCQIVKYKLGMKWISFLEEKFLTPNFSYSDAHEAIFKLDSSIILTPNFDKIYDNYATAQTNNLLKIKKYFDGDLARVLRGNEKQRLILKIHGCIDTPDKLVFTREEYADIRNKYAGFYRIMDALILTHTFLFVGCGMHDPDLALVLEQYARAFGAAPPHYITLPKEKLSDDYIRILETNYNLQVLKYSPANNHIELLDSILALSVLVESRREQLSESNLW